MARETVQTQSGWIERAQEHTNIYSQVVFDLRSWFLSYLRGVMIEEGVTFLDRVEES